MPASAYDIFISYSKEDKATAEAICRGLEESGVRCWIAPRDISEGEDWTAAIMEGMNQCRVMVMVFSGHTNLSPHVHREVSHAFKRGLTVIPFRVEDTAASDRFQYYLDSVQWLNAFPPPIEKYLPRLTERVNRLLSQQTVADVEGDGRGNGKAGVAPPLTARDRVRETNAIPVAPFPAKREQAGGGHAVPSSVAEPRATAHGDRASRKPIALALIAAVTASAVTAGILGLMGYFRSTEKESARSPVAANSPVASPTPMTSPTSSVATWAVASQPTRTPDTSAATTAPTAASVSRETVAPSIQPVAMLTPRSPERSPTPTARPGANFTNSVGQTMTWIPSLRIWAAAHETTQRQYQRVTSANPSAFRGPDRPVDSVTWYDAVRYGEALTELERAAGALPVGFHYRLPKDNEWNAFSEGAEISQAVHGRSRGQGTNDVGSRGGNRYGLYDILGNVWEWCLDDYSPSMDSASVRAQLSDLSRGGKVLRGGSWSTSASSVMLRVDTHGSDRPGEVSNTDGFRVVLVSDN